MNNSSATAGVRIHLVLSNLDNNRRIEIDSKFVEVKPQSAASVQMETTVALNHARPGTIFRLSPVMETASSVIIEHDTTDIVAI